MRWLVFTRSKGNLGSVNSTQTNDWPVGWIGGTLHPRSLRSLIATMEIIVLPYLVISFVIAWAIFSPFAKIDKVDRWHFAPVTISDLLATFLPNGLFLSLATTSLPDDDTPVWLYGSIVLVSFLLAATSLAIGLFLLAKMLPISSLKRIAIIGVIVPLGATLTIAWVALPLWAFAYSILLSIPATLVLVPVTYGLRMLSQWVCSPQLDG